MKLFAETGDKSIPWQIDQKIQRSGLRSAKKAIMGAIAVASTGYKAKYANVSLYEIRKYLEMDKRNLKRHIRDLIKLGLVTFIEVGGRRMYGLKYVSDYYEKHPNKMLGAYKVPGDYMLESGVLKSTDMKGAEKVRALINETLGKPKRRGKKVKEKDSGEKYFWRQREIAKTRATIMNRRHLLGSCLGEA